jgi:hypothetical protein
MYALEGNVHVFNGKGLAMGFPAGTFSEAPGGRLPASLKRLARIAGVFYLAVGITGGFSAGFVDTSLLVTGDAEATTGNVVANAGLVRLGVIAHLADAVFFLLTAATLYLLLKHAGKHAGRLMVVSVIVAAGIICVSAVFTFMALHVATDSSYGTAFGPLGSSALVLLLLEVQHYAFLAAQVFFGLWLAPLGYLASKSRLFPPALCIALILATASYLADVVVAFGFPGLAPHIHGYFSILPAIAEIWMVLYLLTVGVRTPGPLSRLPVQPAPIPA